MIKDLLKTTQYIYQDDFISSEVCAWALASLKNSFDWQAGVLTLYKDHSPQRSDTRICSQILERDYPDEIKILVNEIRQRVCDLLQVPRTHCENSLVVKYAPGGKFDPHSDCGLYPENEREFTVLVTLQAPVSGGETAFVNLPAEVASQAGRVLFWRNLDSEGNPTELMRHAGRPVVLGEKIILVFWLRKNPL